MPKLAVRHEFELETRNRYTKVDAEMAVSVDGKELPNAAVMGEALDKAVEVFEQHIKQSYEVVPERPGTTPAATPVF